MTALSEFYLKYLDFLDLDPTYRITDFANEGATTSGESWTIAGPVASWHISYDRGQILLGVAPTKLAGLSRNWFRLAIVRQYLDGCDETKTVSLTDTVNWARQNRRRIEELFSDGGATASCEALTALEDANAVKYWGPPNS
jgi:hypothetical protein